jgi:hypothetical protein
VTNLLVSQILLDLLITSRHVPSPSLEPDFSSSSSSSTQYTPPALSSVVLDTLLCVLVDSSSALRAFEDAAGVKCVVKILKRAGTPKEVRLVAFSKLSYQIIPALMILFSMKCLEFLYFYLLDEDPTSSPGMIDGTESSVVFPVSPSSVPADAYRAMSPPPLSMPSTTSSPQTKTVPSTPHKKLGLGTRGHRGLRKSNTEGQIPPLPPLPTPVVAPEDLGLISSTSSSRAPSRAESTSSRASSDSRNKPTQNQARSGPAQTPRLHTRTRSEVSQSHRTLSFASSSSSTSSSSKPSSFSSHRPSSSISSVASTSSSTSSKAPSDRRPSISSHPPPLLPVHRPPSLSLSSSQATPTGLRAIKTNSGSSSGSHSTSTSIFASQPNRLVMLRKDVDYVPQTPVKSSNGSQMGHLDGLVVSRRNSDASTTSSTTSSFDGNGNGAQYDHHLLSPRKVSNDESMSSRSMLSTSVVSSSYANSSSYISNGRGRDERKTTEEKKALLGSFLGNVDALVEGVRKAGVWGLS